MKTLVINIIGMILSGYYYYMTHVPAGRFVDCCSLSDFLASMKSDSPADACTPMSENGLNSLLGPLVAADISTPDQRTFTMNLKSDGSYTLSTKGMIKL